jgi:DNA-binding XRE family transcriptional regulator
VAARRCDSERTARAGGRTARKRLRNSYYDCVIIFNILLSKYINNERRSAMTNKPLGTFRQRVEVCLAHAGLTKAELAHALHISQPALWQILDRGAPRVSTLQRLAKVLRVSIAELLRPVTAHELGQVLLNAQKERDDK